MNRLRLLWVAIQVTCCSSIIYAQKLDVASLQEEASKLKTIYKKDDVAALLSTSVYDFVIQDVSMVAKEQEVAEYISLKANTTFVIRNYYNDNSFIESYTLKNEKGRALIHDKLCGHYKQGDIFYSDAQVCAYRLAMNTQGQYARFESTTVFKDPKYLTYIFLHSATPAKKREIVLNIPEWANIELVEMNFSGFDIKKKTTVEKGITTYSYSIENLEAFPDDTNLPGYSMFLPHVLVITKSYTHKNKPTTVLASTDDLYKWYASLTSTIKKNKEALKPKVDELTKGLTSKEDKIKAIYYWVQDNIKYIAFEDGLAAFKPADAHDVFYNRFGDCKGMANLVKDMLVIAGFDARLTWIGTDRLPYTYAVPSLAVNNHMICTVMDGEKRYVIDPTEKYNALGVYAERIQGKEILIEDGNEYILSKVPEESLENYIQESVWHYEIADNNLKGDGKAIINGEHKKDILNMVNSIKTEDLNKFLKAIVVGDSNPDFFTVTNHSDFDREKSLSVSYDINLKNQLYAHEGELYLDLDFADDYKGARLSKDRKVPYKFGSRAFKKTRAELTIPSGYKLEHLPDPLHIENEHFVFDMKYTLSGNKVTYTKEIKILKSILPVSQFTNWNNGIDGIRKFYDDQIILKSK